MFLGIHYFRFLSAKPTTGQPARPKGNYQCQLLSYAAVLIFLGRSSGEPLSQQKSPRKFSLAAAKRPSKETGIDYSAKEMTKCGVCHLGSDGGAPHIVVLQNMHTWLSCLSPNISNGLHRCPSRASAFLEVVC